MSKKHTEILNNPISISFYKTIVPKQAYIATTTNKPTYVFPANRLPRNRHDIDRMALILTDKVLLMLKNRKFNLS